MKSSKTYKVVNIIWLVCAFFGSFCWTFFGPWSVKAIVSIFAFSLTYSLSFAMGIAGLKTTKAFKNDYLLSVISGIPPLVISIIQIILILSKGEGIEYPYYVIAAVSVIQIFVNSIILFKQDGKLFSSQKSDDCRIDRIIRNVFKELLYYLGYLIFAIGSAYIVSAFFVGFTNDIINYYYYPNIEYVKVGRILMSFIGLVAFISSIVSYILFVSEKQKSKAKSVFTIIAIVSFFAAYINSTPSMNWCLATITIVIVGSTLFDKEKPEKIKLNSRLNGLLIALAATLLVLFAVFIIEGYRIYELNKQNNGVTSISFIEYYIELMTNNNNSNYFPLPDTQLLFVRPYVFLPIAVLITILIKRRINKHFIKMLSLVISIASIVTLVESLVNFSRLFPNITQIYPGYLFHVIARTVLYIAMIVLSLILFAQVKQEEPIEEETSENKEVDQQTRKDAIVDFVKNLIPIIVSLVFFFIIPVIQDKFGHSYTPSDYIFNDSGNGVYMRNSLVFALNSVIVILAMELPIFYLLFIVGFNKERTHLFRVLEYVFCGFEVAVYAFYIIIVCISNAVFKTRVMTLAFIPLAVFILWIVALIIYDNRAKIGTAYQNHKEAVARKNEEKQAEKERERERIELEKAEQKIKQFENKECPKNGSAIFNKENQQSEIDAYYADDEPLDNILEYEPEIPAEKNEKPQHISPEDKIRQLKDIVQLKNTGAITDEEFAQLKEEILGGDK